MRTIQTVQVAHYDAAAAKARAARDLLEGIEVASLSADAIAELYSALKAVGELAHRLHYAARNPSR